MFLWIYPLLFLADASLSIIDDVASYFVAVKLLTSIRQLLASGVYFLTIPYIFILLLFKFEKPAPYWLLPAFNLVFTIVSGFSVVKLVEATSLFTVMALDMSPHFIYNKHPYFFLFQLMISVLQLGIGIYSFRFALKNQANAERRVFRIMAPGAASLSFLMFFFMVNIATIIFMFSASSGGFLTLSGDKIVSIEKVYEKDGKIVHLIPMIHVGEENFYKEISALDISKKTLILLEGVKDKQNLLASISYRKMANATGLSTQEENFRPMAKTKELQKNLSYLVADVDASEFSPETRTFINQVIKDMNEKSFFALLVSNYDNNGASDSISHLSVDLIEKRNQKVLLELMANESKFDEFYIPWGAAHLPEIERELLKTGFKEVDSKRRVIISLSEALK